MIEADGGEGWSIPADLPRRCMEARPNDPEGALALALIVLVCHERGLNPKDVLLHDD